MAQVTQFHSLRHYHTLLHPQGRPACHSRSVATSSRQVQQSHPQSQQSRASIVAMAQVRVPRMYIICFYSCTLHIL